MNKYKIFHFIPSLIGSQKFVLPCYANTKMYNYSCTIIYSNDNFKKKNFIKNKKINTVEINNFKLGSNLFFKLVAFFNILKLIYQRRPKVVVAHFTTGAILPLICAKLLCVKHRIYFNHGVSYQSYNGFVKLCLRIIEKINIWLSSGVLTVSMGSQRKLKKLSSKKPVKLIHHGSASGLKLTNYSFKKLYKIKCLAKATLGFNFSDTVILYVGRDVARKGIFEVIEIINNLTHEKFKFIIIGIKNKNLIKNIQSKKIKILQFKENIENFYKASDFVILPSKHEGFGYSLAEGASYGSIPLATNVDGPRDIIINGYSGYLINVKSTSKYIKYIKLISRNQKLKKLFSYRAYLSVKKYNRDVYINHYHKYFETLLKN